MWCKSHYWLMSLKIIEPIEFLCENNHYLIDGKKYYRVTKIKSIIKNDGLVSWQVSMGRKKAYEIMKKRREFGTRLHKLYQLILYNKKINSKNYDKETQDSLKLFKDFISEYDIKPELLEQHLWSDKYNYAGTADFIGYIDGKLMIGDWKTSKNIYPEYWLQLAAYAVAFEELTNKKVDGCFILMIRDNKKKIEFKTYNEISNEFEIFKACIKIYSWLNK